VNEKNSVEKRQVLRQRLKSKPILIAPGAYDAFTAILIEYIGFEAVYMSGAGVSAALVGFPDIGLISMTEMVEQTSRMADSISLPLICDADTGYGEPLNVRRTVQQFEKAGASAIHLEDQVMPKRCGHLEGKQVISTALMINKLKAALDARKDENFIIIARTDARATHGIDEAIERAHLYGDTGVDVLFVEAPESIEELRLIARQLSDFTLLVNRGGGGKTPLRSAAEFDEMGYSIVIFPGDLQRTAGKAMLKLLEVLKTTGNTTDCLDDMLGFEERFEIMGLSQFWQLGSRYKED
jgi:2-methylisocitrate lyase-like PEP mutase family enzyme